MAAPAQPKPKSKSDYAKSDYGSKSASGSKPKWRRRRRRGPPRRGRVDLDSIVTEVLEKHIPPEVQRLSKLRNLWLELFPDSFADHVWPMIVQQQRLIVYVHDSQWLHEMTYWRQDALDKLDDAWPESGIEFLEAYVGALPPMSQRRPPKPPDPPVINYEPVLDADVPGETVEALNSIRDPSLREALAQARVMLGKRRD